MSSTAVEGMTYVLYEGDTVLVGVTHEVSVGRDRSWVKYEATTKVQTGESAEHARWRAIGHVNESVGAAVNATVEQIRSNR